MSRQVHHAIDVTAPVAACWSLFTDLSSWTEWFPALAEVRSVGPDRNPFQVGGRLHLAFRIARWKAFGIEVTVRDYEPETRIRWVGGGFGITGEHEYRFSMNSSGATRVTSHEEFSGFAVRLMTRKIFDHLDLEAHRSLERFQKLAEARACA